MDEKSPATSAAKVELIANRFAPDLLLGRGGAGEVFRVLDRTGQRAMALKRLSAHGHPRRDELALQFEREYHSLSQLKHPCIVEVFDYGVDEGSPYYTMELLDGSDLRELSPMPWARACVLLCDVASALGLLHSRRLVHRDLTPRNVRCTSNGRAKLIDFGAMAAMGPSKHLIGTPAYVAPELVNGQELDARSDLFSLGALAYFMLTGRHAFRAQSFKQLRDVWRTRPVALSSIASDIPQQLQGLVTSLLSVDPQARPSNTAEVIGRLRALLGESASEIDDSKQAYLTTPSLVGHHETLISLRKRMLRLLRGAGSSFLIEGDTGSGRSRVLASAVLEAKLAGALVVSAEASEGRTGTFDIVRQLITALLEIAPELTRACAVPYAPALAQLFPELVPEGTQPALDADVSEAVAGMLCAIADHQPLCLAIDDLQHADLPSAGLVARLATSSHGRALLIVATTTKARSPGIERAIAQLGDASARVVLAPLTRAETELLLGSVFGSVTHLSLIAGWIHELSGGKPRVCVELAQHLVEREIARFVDGEWTLPNTLDGLSLPLSFEQAQEQRFAEQAPCARELAQLAALFVPLVPLALSDYMALLAPQYPSKDVFAAIDALMRNGMLVQTEGYYALRGASVRALVKSSMQPEQERALHARLAAHYRQRPGTEAVVGYHLLYAGDFETAYQIQHGLRGQVTDIASLNALFSRSDVGVAQIEELYRQARARKLPPARLLPISKLLVQLASITDSTLAHYVDDIVPQLKKDCGLDFFEEHGGLPDMERVVRSLQRAQERYDRTPEAERGLDPLTAIRELAIVVGTLSGISSRTADPMRAVGLAELIAPFRPLSPAISILHDLVASTTEALVYGTHGYPARELLMEKLREPVEGLDELTRQGALHILDFYQGLDNAIRADPRALERANELASHTTYAPLAWQLRAVYHDNAGDLGAAEHARQQRDLHALQSFDSDGHVICSTIYEISIAGWGGDLIAIKRLRDRAAIEAERYPGWKLWHSNACARFEALRGDTAAALRHVERTIELTPTSGHAARTQATILKVELLAKSGEPRRAIEIGQALLDFHAPRGTTLNDGIGLALAIARAESMLGEHAHAAARIEAQIAQRGPLELRGVPLTVLYIERARIALLARDREAFGRFGELAAKTCARMRHPGVLAQLQQLVGEAREAQQPIGSELARSADLTVIDEVKTVYSTAVQTMFGACHGGQERTNHALELLVVAANAQGGYLFGCTGAERCEALAWLGVDAPTVALEQRAQEWLDAARESEELVTKIEANNAAEPDAAGQDHGFQAGLQPFLLRSGQPGQSEPLGVLLLAAGSDLPLRVPLQTLSAVCEGLVRAGDLVAR